MPNGNGRTVTARKLHGAVKLRANVSFVLGIVKEHLALNHLYARTLSGTHRLAVADGHAVEEVEIVAFQRLHHFQHSVQAGGHRAAHMVVQAYGIRHFVVGVADDALDLIAAHIRAQGIFFQRLLAERCHRQMDEHLMTAIVCFGRHLMRVRCIRQDGDGNGRRHRQHLIFIVWTITEVINHDGEFTCVYRCSQRQRADDGENHSTKLKQNLSSQPRLWIDRLTLTTNFEIE